MQHYIPPLWSTLNCIKIMLVWTKSIKKYRDMIDIKDRNFVPIFLKTFDFRKIQKCLFVHNSKFYSTDFRFVIFLFSLKVQCFKKSWKFFFLTLETFKTFDRQTFFWIFQIDVSFWLLKCRVNFCIQNFCLITCSVTRRLEKIHPIQKKVAKEIAEPKTSKMSTSKIKSK